MDDFINTWNAYSPAIDSFNSALDIAQDFVSNRIENSLNNNKPTYTLPPIKPKQISKPLMRPVCLSKHFLINYEGDYLRVWVHQIHNYSDIQTGYLSVGVLKGLNDDFFFDSSWWKCPKQSCLSSNMSDFDVVGSYYLPSKLKPKKYFQDVSFTVPKARDNWWRQSAVLVLMEDNKSRTDCRFRHFIHAKPDNLYTL